jgi:hypothetical protein
MPGSRMEIRPRYSSSAVCSISRQPGMTPSSVFGSRIAANTTSRGASSVREPRMFIGRRFRLRAPEPRAPGPLPLPHPWRPGGPLRRHRLLGGVRVVGAEGIEQDAMVMERGLPDVAQTARPLAAHPAERADDVHELEQQEVARRGTDRNVELDIELAEPERIVDRRLQCRNERVEVREVVLGHPKGREADVAGLDDPARLEELDESHAVLREDEVEVGDQLPRLERRDVRAVALADVDDAHEREGPQRLADDRPADLHHLGELALGGELVARTQLLFADLHQEAIRDLLRERAPRHDRESTLASGSCGVVFHNHILALAGIVVNW